MNKNNGVPKIAGWSSWLARESHNLEVGGSSPPPATNVRMPEWSKGVVCKTIIHRFKSDSSLY